MWCQHFCNITQFQLTHVDHLLVGGVLSKDMISVSWADPDLREGQKFLGHLFQQSPHLQQGYAGLIWGFTGRISPVHFVLAGSGSPPCSCAQSGAAGDTAPVWSDASPRTHQKPARSRPAETAA